MSNTEKGKKPNILWICTDQQRFDTLGCYGNTFVNTPHLDGLAETGLQFNAAYSQSPVCTPSRGSFLTGRYPTTCGTRQNGADIPDTELLVTKILKDNGYRCGLSGKLHLSACNPESGCTEMERRINDGYSDFHWSHDTSAFWGNFNEYYHWLKKKGHSYETPSREDCSWVQKGMPEDLHQTTWCVEKAMEFIDAEDDSPWLFSLNCYDPHHPFDPPEEYLEPYLAKLDEIPLPVFDEDSLDNKTPWHRIDNQGAYGRGAGYPYSEMSDRDHRMVKAAYWAMCDLIDKQVGRLLNHLREKGLAENTLVIFTSDHGELLGDYGIYLKGPYFYECASRVPLLLNWPGTIQEGVCETMVELVDIPQTILDICGIEHHSGMQGWSFQHLLNNPEASHREDVYAEYFNAMPWHSEPLAWASMARNKRYKIIQSQTADMGELYDLEEDPRELRNLWASEEHKDVKIEMLMLLNKRMALTADPLPVRKSEW